MNGCTGEKVVFASCPPVPNIVAREEVTVDGPSTIPQNWDSPQNPGFKRLCRTLAPSPHYRYSTNSKQAATGKKKKPKKLWSPFFFFPHLFCLHSLSTLPLPPECNIKPYQQALSPPHPPHPLSSVAELQREVKGQA